MVQVLCKIWGVGMLSILALTTSNILLTLRLLHTGEDMGSTCGSASFSHYSQSWTDGLKDANHTSYLEFLRKTTIVVGKSRNNEIGNYRHLSDSTNNRFNAQIKHNLLSENSRNSGNSEQIYDNSNEDSGMFIIDPKMGRFDNRRIFKTFDKVFTGPDYKRLVDKSPACLATQSSVDRLYWLAQVSKHWENAPISLAIYVPDVEYSIARAYLKYLVTCFPFLGKKVTVHFTFPRQFPPKEMPIQLDNLLVLCDQPVTVLKQLLKMRPSLMLKWRETMQYPQNLLRNVARKNCGTEWVFLTDVDIIPIPGLANDVATFLRSREANECKKCAFVVPTYEVNERASLPYNRTLLLKLVAAGRARPFHQKVFVYNQHATNFSRWEAREKVFPNEAKVTISHNVTSFEFFYEPFYIARDHVPPHDERFLGYGFTRNTQVYEMYVAGYNFRVLSPVFTLHWGMQVKRSRPAWRERQNSANRKLFEGFKREIYAKYQKDPLGMMKEKTKNRSRKRH